LTQGRVWAAAVVLLLALITSCGATEEPVNGSQTNWLTVCESSNDCGSFECVCGTCTATCLADEDCADLEGSACVGPDDTELVAACDGSPPQVSVCLPRCDRSTCPEGECVAGVCQSTSARTATVSIDATVQYQALIGIGASLSHDEDFIVGYADKQKLFDVMFSDSGFDIVRMRNRYEPGNGPALLATQEIISAAASRLGHEPTLFLSSGSPPAALKANGTRSCEADDANCTLSRSADGGFDYDGFAQHWRTSLEAYEQVGIHPDFVSIQSNVDWMPAETAAEACYFLPHEGSSSVTTDDGVVVNGEFPGYAEAMAAVVASTSSLPGPYAFAGPEVGHLANLDAYADVLGNVDSVAYHLYGTDPTAVARGEAQEAATLQDTVGKPAIQSAMQADGFATAILAHYALAIENSAGYLQQQFVAPTFDETSTALVGADQNGIEKLPAYAALWHFARYTDPGWVRVEATVDTPDVLASAWVPPEGSAVTVVVINTGLEAVDVGISELLVGAQTHVYRSAFDGVERMEDLGPLPDNRVVQLPGHAMATVTVGPG
jgi:glucuronoarabinoxylan endo-1,4-beta-xylanase